MEHVAKGHKKSHKAKQLHHIKIHAGEDATHEKPSWTVEHHFAPTAEGGRGLFSHQGTEPESYQFTNHREMLRHVEKHTGTTDPEEGAE